MAKRKTPTYIAEQLRPLAVALDALKLDPDNVRTHDERNLRAIASSLVEFGQRKPIVVRKVDSTIIAGNGTARAALDLGWEQIAAVLVDDDATTSARYAIADNRTAELAGWDDAALASLLIELAELDQLVPGFEDDADLEILLARLDDAARPPRTPKGKGKDDDKGSQVRFVFGDVGGLVSSSTYQRFRSWYDARQQGDHVLLDDLITEVVEKL